MFICVHLTGSSLVITLVVYHIGLPVLHSPCNELCSEHLAKVKQNICHIVRFKVVLTCALDLICVNVRLSLFSHF